MPSPMNRSRASTLQDTGLETVELRSQLQVLGQDRGEFGQQHVPERRYQKLEAAHRVRQCLLEDSGVTSVRDTFRHLNGFQTLVVALMDLSTTWTHQQGASTEDHDLSLNLLQALFGILAAALQNHKGNQKYFLQRVEGGGWLAFHKHLSSILFHGDKAVTQNSEDLKEGVFGCLLACALNDESITSFFKKMKRMADIPESLTSEPKSSSVKSIPGLRAPTSKSEVKEESSKTLHSNLTKEFDPLATVIHGHAIALMFELWRGLSDAEAHTAIISKFIPSVINHLASLSVRNIVALHGTGLLKSALACVLGSTIYGIAVVSELRDLVTALLRLGVTDLDDAQFLYRNARSSPFIGDLLLTALTCSRSPSYIHFDLSLHGFASVELPGIGRAFPPLSPSSGYTLSLWFQITRFDPNSHTTIFGAFDASQTCFVLLYLEKDTHNLILQTSVSSSRPSVRFKSMSFKDSRWYHVVITHRRPKTTSSSRASLFVDGEFIEQVKSLYPAAPPSVLGDDSGAAADRKRGAIQVFLGTPRDLASHLGKGRVSTQWRLASANLFADVLSDDLIAVYFELSPRYTGNYQDCLGSFQTYRASAALNLRNEGLHPGKEEKSDIVTAIRSKAGVLLPEQSILLNISANLVFDDDDHNNIDETHLLKFISKAAGKNLRNVTRGGRNALAINGAIPSINEALLHSSGFAVLTGDPIVVVPQLLDDAAWRIGGCAAVGLALLEAAHGSDNVVRALRILLESIQESWRNSEAMERENGFGVLSNLLDAKLSQQTSESDQETEAIQSHESAGPSPVLLSLRVLIEILKFVGYRADKPENSVINNPLAYRILLVDMDFWRSAETQVQELYYEQFIVFGTHSKYHLFNMKRLSRMRVTKKWLDALKGDIFTAPTFGFFLEAFQSLLTKSLSTDSMRSLALYITYAIHKPRQISLLPSRAKSIKLNTESPSRRKTLGSPAPHLIGQQSNSVDVLTQMQVALRVLELYTNLLCHKDDFANIHKFARTVTNKWLLHLLADDEPAVVVLATKILARLLVASGPAYVQKFVDKTGGVVIMQHRLKRWWSIPTIWPIVFAVFFGVDVATIEFSRTFDLFSLLETFASGSKPIVLYPVMLPVITAMLEEGLKTVTRDQSDPESPLVEKSNENTSALSKASSAPAHKMQRSMTLPIETSNSKTANSSMNQLTDSVSTLRTITRFLADVHTKSLAFRDFTTVSLYVQELFFVLFPIVVSANPVSPDTELHSRDSTLTFQGGDVIMRPLSINSMGSAPIVRTSTVEPTREAKSRRAQAPRRMSSYILVTSDHSRSILPGRPIGKLKPILSPDRSKTALSLSSSIVEELLELTIAVFSDQIFSRKDFPGLGLFMRVPPGFQEHQAYFETFILRNTLSQLGNVIKLDQKLLLEPRVLTNLARFATHLGEAIYEGWFIDGAEDTLEFIANVLEYLQLPNISTFKAVRLCNQVICNIRTVFSRVVLLRLSELDESASTKETDSFLNRLVYWQTVLLSADQSQERYFKLLCYLVYIRLTSTNADIRIAAANLWRMMFVQKPDEVSTVLLQAVSKEKASLMVGFRKIMELDNEAFLSWVNDNHGDLEDICSSSLSKSWEAFVSEENQKTKETAKARIQKRREKLKTWVMENCAREEVLRRHETAADHWRSNIYAAEHLKRQRALQDRQDSQAFSIATWTKMSRGLHRPCGVFDDNVDPKWQLDQTEGRNRMRMRTISDKNAHLQNYQPKRRQSQGPAKSRNSISASTKPIGSNLAPLPDKPVTIVQSTERHQSLTTGKIAAVDHQDEDANEEFHEDFEMVDNPQDELAEYEDKNRKVMRSLQRGDQVEHVHNVSRIVGLEATEGLLILGKGHFYLLDNLFQRSDGEVVNVWQAPQEERDPYLQMISGREAGERPPLSIKDNSETRSWRWDDVLSISKRRFLFRDVAIEVFFVDGRSYLLTTSSPLLRNELYQKLLSKATGFVDRASLAGAEDAWRVDAVRNTSDETQSFGSKFTNVFAHNISNPATRKWVRGEMSNFHYLMIINTMAGRTFNDLTQYPVFPWVLADYTSEELDLTNPRTFRDLSKPMGCQNSDRQVEFRDRYQSFAEMGDENSPPFHYGTHYSSAMIVTTYLIRLQPFVHSYLLLQGGSFDHPDRLFYSIEKAWSSASRDNMTDVRELIPEFYYLPEFLVNQNGYDFGNRQGNGGPIDTVTLPPWAKGDPKIFIAKHREALESEYVSQHLHQWIDLIFGHKQRGDAALEATNVFHHLSYHGARDLDTINDPVERLATIGIIHNFGQTPHQIFQRNHVPREERKHQVKKLDTGAESLTRLPFSLSETHDRVSSLQYSLKHDRVLSSGPFRINIGPAYEKYIEWGFIDGSVRFYSADTNKLVGLFEHVHQGQLSYLLSADSKTLVAAGSDCTISLWAVVSTATSVDLQPKTCLFGHRSAVTILAVSRSFSALLSASSDGQVLLWDLNRLELVRQLTTGGPVECARINDVSGVVILCRHCEVSLWTLNGDVILKQEIYVEGDGSISSCAFYEGSGIDYLERHLIFTGHQKGVVNVWSMAIRDSSFVLEHVKRMHHLDPAGYNIGAKITSILPMAQKVYTGDDDGRVFEWDCIQRQ